jgi:hypothetical protein
MTARLVTVKSSGGDYTTLNAAFVGEVGDLTAAGLNRQLEIDCYNFVDSTAAASGAAWTTDASHTVLITAVDNHGGLYGGSGGTGAYSNSRHIDPAIGFATLRGLSVGQSDTDHAFFISGANTRVERCIAQTAAASTTGFAPFSGGTNCHLENCLVVGDGVHPQVAFSLLAATGTTTLYNCASVNALTAFHPGGANTVAAINCLASGVSGNGFGTGTWTGSGTCASSDGTSPSSGAGHRINQTFTFVNVSGGDYHLAAADRGARGFGTDLTADSSFPLAVDIDNVARPAGLWDIGADQAVTAALGGTVTAAITETDIVSGAKTITLTLTGDLWTPA